LIKGRKSKLSSKNNSKSIDQKNEIYNSPSRLGQNITKIPDTQNYSGNKSRQVSFHNTVSDFKDLMNQNIAGGQRLILNENPNNKNKRL
jgi:hypothetical protein